MSEARRKMIDPAGICAHEHVKRQSDEEELRFIEKWECEHCTAEFYHLQNIGSGSITIMEPHATLRDQFAMAALTGLLADPSTKEPLAVKASYVFADAMMDARNTVDKHL